MDQAAGRLSQERRNPGVEVGELDTEGFLSHLRSRDGYAGQIVHVESLPRQSAEYRPLKSPLNPLLQVALQMRGVDRFYSHQAAAIDALQEGRHVVTSAGPASGKSLCYNAPILNACLDPNTASATALYLFPVKALAHDQLRALEELAAPLPKRLSIAAYDGDTPSYERGAVRKNARLLLTNPEMLHLGILPNHKLWARFLRHLRFVVIDEAHVYRGVFGSHIALLLRRLRRLCALYGANPQFILTSATLGNPKEHAERLTGLDVVAVTEDGAPSEGREFALWNPPIIDDANTVRRSPMREGTEIFSTLVASGTRTLSFVRSRQTAELMYRYAREQLARIGTTEAGSISSYRAGYVPEERREIERQLAEGELTGVVTTNALELGIDIGDLDATLLNGYPGSLAATFQQAGRSGRRDSRALTIMVVSDNPLEQYLARHPDILFRRGAEHARISTTNPKILDPHLVCASVEAPINSIAGDAELFGGEDIIRDAVDRLTDERLLIPRESRRGNARWHTHPNAGSHPAGDVHLRSTSGELYTLVDENTGRILETISEEHAFSNAHEGAVYLHRGEEFIVDELDLLTRIATLHPARLPYYTVSMEDTYLRIMETQQDKQEGAARVSVGPVDVTRTVHGYSQRRHDRNEILSREVLDLPPRSFETVALWWTVPNSLLEKLARKKVNIPGALHACEHAAIGLLPLFALCDRWDIGGLSTPRHPDTGEATIFIYDGIPGGVGIAERGYEIVRELWGATLAALNECPCEEGCPSCVQSPKCGNNNEPLDKRGARMLLEMVLGVNAESGDRPAAENPRDLIT